MTITWNVGDAFLGPEYEMLARIAAIFRVVLSMERANTFKLGLGRIFQSPPDVPASVAQKLPSDTPTYSDEELARGLELCNDAITSEYTGYETVSQFPWSWMVYGVFQGIKQPDHADPNWFPPRIAGEGEYGYIVLPCLPLSRTSDANPYAESLVASGVRRVIHAGFDRLICPISTITWAQEQGGEYSLGITLPCGLILHRMLRNGIFYTIFVQTPGQAVPPGLAESFLEQLDLGESKLEREHEFQNWFWQIRQVPHPYGQAQAHFQRESFPETLLLLTCHPLLGRAFQSITPFDFERLGVPLTSMVSRDASSLGENELLAQLGKVPVPVLTTSLAQTLARSVILAQVRADDADEDGEDNVGYDLIAVASICKAFCKGKSCYSKSDCCISVQDYNRLLFRFQLKTPSLHGVFNQSCFLMPLLRLPAPVGSWSARLSLRACLTS
jgi:hypothetical protein